LEEHQKRVQQPGEDFLLSMHCLLPNNMPAQLEKLEPALSKEQKWNLKMMPEEPTKCRAGGA